MKHLKFFQAFLKVTVLDGIYKYHTGTELWSSLALGTKFLISSTPKGTNHKKYKVFRFIFSETLPIQFKVNKEFRIPCSIFFKMDDTTLHFAKLRAEICTFQFLFLHQEILKRLTLEFLSSNQIQRTPKIFK